MEALRSNRKIELAREFILNTRANIFLTGKAGTGKTTFLRSVVTSIGKRAVIAAPTGVAALNAGGVTLHSLFQLPFGPNIPGVRVSTRYGSDGRSFGQRISKSKLSLIRSIELLLIDEVSMVRSDTLDAIDETLRRVRRSMLPFGGVQLLLIGDIQQLSPICRDEEWELLREHYSTPYFFDSQALKRSTYVTIEFDEIFRQKDSHFTDILNAIRENRATHDILDDLNQRYIPNFEPKDSDDYITLTTHNSTANAINSRKLAELRGATTSYDAKVTGEFSDSAYPNDTTLELKVGAQVLFIKNDVSPQKRYYNGLLGRVTAIDDKSVTVQPKSSSEAIRVEAVLWESVDYAINRESGEMEQVVKGTFSQIPLKCAWAITIHKSQGLSFDRAVIDASGSFAHGQVYVALSRCRSLEGMVLRRPIEPHSIIGDNNIEGFSQYVRSNQPSDEMLAAFKRDNFIRILCEIYDFEALQRLLWDLMSELTGAISKTYPKLTSTLMDLLGSFDSSIVKIGAGFQREIKRLVFESDGYESDEHIKGRLRSASDYFTPRLDALQTIIRQLEVIQPDSAESRRKIKELTVHLSRYVSLTFASLSLCKSGFSIDKYLSERARLIALESLEERDERSTKREERSVKRGGAPKSEVPSDITHQDLYDTLVAWRQEEAIDAGVKAYAILTNKSLIHIQSELPTSEQEMINIHGMGKIKMRRYSDQIIEIVKEYCFSNGIDIKKVKKI